MQLDGRSCLAAWNLVARQLHPCQRGGEQRQSMEHCCGCMANDSAEREQRERCTHETAVLLDRVQRFSRGRSVAPTPDPRQVTSRYEPGQLTRGVADVTKLAGSSKKFHVSNATTKRRRTEHVGQICGWRGLSRSPVDSAASATSLFRL